MRDCLALRHNRGRCAVCGSTAQDCPLKHPGLFRRKVAQKNELEAPNVRELS
jgi:hypothetical protein